MKADVGMLPTPTVTRPIEGEQASLRARRTGCSADDPVAC